MIFSITTALLVAEENFKIRAGSIDVYLSVYRRFAQFVETLEDEENETDFLEALVRYRSDYLCTVPQKSQAYHKSALSYWKRVKISEDSSHLPSSQNFDKPLKLKKEHTKAPDDSVPDVVKLSDAYTSLPSHFGVLVSTSENIDKQPAQVIEIGYRKPL